jgi:enoyl-[acyl-carrier protein] reductase II
MIITAIREGRGHELVPFAGQSAGLIHDILLPAAGVVDRIVKEAREALQVATKLL